MREILSELPKEVEEQIELEFESTPEILGKYQEVAFQKYGGADARPGMHHQ